MKVFLLANNIVGLEVCRHLLACGDEIVGLAIHEPEKQKYAPEILAECHLGKDRVFYPGQLGQPEALERIRGLGAEIGISAFWGSILRKEFFGIFPKGCINFHPAYLPYNKGKNPNVWPIVEGTPAGVSLHYIDESVDGGDIIARRVVEIEPTDTGGSLYDKTLAEIVELFKEEWPAIKEGGQKRLSQNGLESTFHLAKHIDALDLIDLDEKTTAGALINKIRSRTYGNKSYAYFIGPGNKKIEIGVFLKYKKSN